MPPPTTDIPPANARPQRAAKPDWLRRHLPAGGDCAQIRQFLRKKGLHSVCESARCPNRWECFSRRTATFMIMGDRCTRNCRFCAVATGPTGPPEPSEPLRLARAAREMQLQHVVLTSVTREDLPDHGAGCFVQTIGEIRRLLPQATVEVLTPDFGGSRTLLHQVLNAGPDVWNHNVETVAGLYGWVRPEASYDRSLGLLAETAAFRPQIPVKSGIMLGLGERGEEVARTLRDLFAAGCRLLTLGQYLQPTVRHLPVKRYVPPKEFEQWRRYALQLGFAAVASGPLVRSSYRARLMFQNWQTRQNSS